jgi:NAD(P)-dependent dehydrogenase (short-subunit alcohol dehydrogenase family)
MRLHTGVKTALITGGTGGLGSAVTACLLAAGWRCVVPFQKEDEAQRLSQSIGADQQLARLELLRADLLDERQTQQVAQAAHSTEAPLAAVINLLGGFDAPGLVHETPVERFEQQLRLNLRGAYLACASALPSMIERGQGRIVCVSSRAALMPFAGAAGYVTSKAAVLALVDAMAAEYTGQGITVNAVLPSVIDTQANRAAQPNADYSRWVKPSEIAAVIGFLCSSASAPISGAHIPVYGRA